MADKCLKIKGIVLRTKYDAMYMQTNMILNPLKALK